MPIKELPIAVFISYNDANIAILDFVKEIIAKTHMIFTRGSGNRIMDLRQNPNAFYELESSRMQIMPLDLLDPNLFKLTKLLDQNDGSRFMNMLNGLLQSYKHGIGNCGEMASVGLYLITNASCEFLHTATLVTLSFSNHCFIKLESTNNTVIFIDPWYKTHEYHGAIFDPSSLDTYLSHLSPMLNATRLSNLIGPFYPARHLVGGILLALCVYDPQKSFLILGGISIISLLVLVALVLESFTHTPTIIEKLQLSNTHDQSTFNFELFKKICDHNLEKIDKNPVLFSNGALNLKNNKNQLNDGDVFETIYKTKSLLNKTY